MDKYDICIYIRDYLGNIDIVDTYKNKLTAFAKVNLPDYNQVIFIDKDYGIDKNKDILSDLYKHLEERHTKWVIVPHIDKFAKSSYSNGFQSINEITEKILSYGTGIISFNEEKVITPNNKIFELSKYKFNK